MCKDVLVSTYHGSVFLKNVPNNKKKKDVLEIVRKILNEDILKRNCSNLLTDLYNVDYYVNVKAREYIEQNTEFAEHCIYKDYNELDF